MKAVGAGHQRGVRGWLRRRWWVVYLALMALSCGNRVLNSLVTYAPPAHQHRISLPAMTVRGPTALDSRLAYYEWGEGVGRPVVVLIHGSPGSGADFRSLAEPLVKAGYRVIAPDLPGFGDSTLHLPDYSAQGHARSLLALLDHLEVRRVHVVGWSLGGAVSLHMYELLGNDAPSRMASLTLLGASADQETEGSGSYAVERLTYGFGYIVGVWGVEAVPHFGLLGAHHFRRNSIMSFWDTDLRPFRGVMKRLRVPTLVLHGRHDFLVPDWAAEEHARTIPGARLVMLDASHFIPFLQAKEAAGHLDGFFSRHDTPGAPAEGRVLDFCPKGEPRTLFHRWWRGVQSWCQAAPWPAETGLIAILVLAMPRVGTMAGLLLLAAQAIDVTVCAIGLTGGFAARSALMAFAAQRSGLGRWILRRAEVGEISASDWRRRLGMRPFKVGLLSALFSPHRDRAMVGAALTRHWSVWFLAGRLLGICFLALALALVGRLCAMFGLPRLASEFGAIGTAAGIVLLWSAVGAVPLLLTWAGRCRLTAALARWRHHEYWPTWLFYVPLYPYLLYLTVRYRGLGTFSLANPGVEHGGGLVGESKAVIFRGLERGLRADQRAELATTVLIPAGPTAERIAIFNRARWEHGSLSGFPVILKPDSGQRGFAFRLVRSDADAASYLGAMTRDAVVQPYFAGPQECGIMWMRFPRAPEGPGRIFSITRKTFPTVTGDGRRTLEELLFSHRRFRRQADVFLTRFKHRATEVIGKDEVLRLAVAGNHAQGTLFEDGADLITPELTAAIDRLGKAFRDESGHALDLGRFDVRYRSDEELRRGGAFTVIELNGTFGESTNMYDPKRSYLWAAGVLLRQWREMFELGAARRRAGAQVMTWRTFFSLIFRHYRGRPGSEVAD